MTSTQVTPALYQCQALPEQFGRPVLSCDACGLVQFVPELGRCRRCRVDFTVEPLDVLAAEAYVDAEPKAKITKAIRFCRVAVGLTQQEVADRMGTPRSNISRIERGAVPTPQTAVRLAAALGVPMWVFCALCEMRGL